MKTKPVKLHPAHERRTQRKRSGERAPQYADLKDCPYNHLYRVVSRPNGLWRAERRIDRSGQDTRVHDVWEAIGGDTDLASACHTRDVWAVRNGPPARSASLLPENTFE